MLPWLHVLINATQASPPSCETKSIFHPENMKYKLRGHRMLQEQRPRDCSPPRAPEEMDKYNMKMSKVVSLYPAVHGQTLVHVTRTRGAINEEVTH